MEERFWNILNQSLKRKISSRYWESMNFVIKTIYIPTIGIQKEMQSKADTKTYWELVCWQWKLKMQYLSYLVKYSYPTSFLFLSYFYQSPKIV